MKINKRTIAIVTGSRAEYGSLQPILKQLSNSQKFNFILYVTGMHLLQAFGNTVEEIKKDYSEDMKLIPMYIDKSSKEDSRYIGFSISNALKNFTEAFSINKPDLVLLIGDRVEMLAACIAAASLQIPIAHVHGGDATESGQIDEQVRHALTKFAHLHFTATELSKKRVLQMGEEDWRVFNTGSSSQDNIVNEKPYSKEELYQRLGIQKLLVEKLDFILCIFHSYILEHEKSGIYMRNLLDSLNQIGNHIVISYPNNDPGCNLIIEEIESNKSNPNFHIYKNLDRKTFLSAMKHCILMIGNSSSGIIESANFKIPVVNIGKRNFNREGSENVINVENDKDSILKGIQKATSLEFLEFCKTVKNKYGDGTAGKKIVEILEKVKIDENLKRKKFILRV